MDYPDRQTAEARAAKSDAEWRHADEMTRSLNRTFSDTEGKRIVKEAIKEWLDEQFAAVGKWTLTGLAAAMLGVLAYLILTSQGWHK